MSAELMQAAQHLADELAQVVDLARSMHTELPIDLTEDLGVSIAIARGSIESFKSELEQKIPA